QARSRSATPAAGAVDTRSGEAIFVARADAPVFCEHRELAAARTFVLARARVGACAAARTRSGRAVALLARIEHAVAAMRRGTVGAARVRLRVGIAGAGVALFRASARAARASGRTTDDAVAACGERAVVAAVVGIDRVAIVALLDARAYESVAADGIL